MQLPSEVPVMTLPEAILFPGALLPLYIFEPRYQKMLADSLETHRMFSVAMQKPGRKRETPCLVGGVGLIRASVRNSDSSSYLILQGLARVELTETLRYKPYRVSRIEEIKTARVESVMVDALTAKILELVRERLEQGLDMPVHVMQKIRETGTLGVPGGPTLKQLLEQLASLDDPEQLGDLVCCTLLRRAEQRQTILETLDLEVRLKTLVHYLLAEVRKHRAKKKDG